MSSTQRSHGIDDGYRDPAAGSSPWGVGAWSGWSLLVALQLAASLVAAFLILWGASTTCDQPASSANLIAGLRDVAIAAALPAGGWLLAFSVRPGRWPRWLVGWLIGALPLLAVAATHTSTQDWVGSFCF